MNLVAEITFQSAVDLSLLVESLRSRGSVDSRRVGLWGLSLGCHTVLAAVPMCRPDAVSAAYGTAAWNRMWELSWPYFHPGLPAPEVPHWRPSVAALVKSLDPIAHPGEFFPAALLLLHGRDDQPMVEGMRALHEALAPHYRPDPARLMFDLHPGGHLFTKKTDCEMRDWLRRWLA
jgi:dienelactone hydrolase